MKRPDHQPTPAQWRWWATTIANIARAFGDRRCVTPAETAAQVDNRDARMRAALRDWGNLP